MGTKPKCFCSCHWLRLCSYLLCQKAVQSVPPLGMDINTKTTAVTSEASMYVLLTRAKGSLPITTAAHTIWTMISTTRPLGLVLSTRRRGCLDFTAHSRVHRLPSCALGLGVMVAVTTSRQRASSTRPTRQCEVCRCWSRHFRMKDYQEGADNAHSRCVTMYSARP